MRSLPRRCAAPLAVLVLLAGCGDQTAGAGAQQDPVQRPAEVPAADSPVVTRRPATVLDEGDGPRACLGSIGFSLPPQCGGVPLEEWDWSDHEGDHETSGGVRWGSFVVTGTFDGTTLTVTGAAPASEHQAVPPPEPDFTSPCDPPVGGWRAVDPALVSQQALSKAHRVAEGLPGYSLSWGDHSLNPAWHEFMDGPTPERMREIESRVNDPELTILNVAVTGDVASAEAELRKTWGGPLCVSQAAHSRAQLRAAAEDLVDLPGVLDSQFGSISQQVEVEVVFDDGRYQRWVDAEYGEGVVKVTSALVTAD